VLQWESLLQQLCKKYEDLIDMSHLYTATGVNRLSLPEGDRSALVHLVQSVRYQTRKLLHGNRRKKLRERVSSQLHRIEKCRQAGKLALPIKVLTGKASKSYSMDYLINHDGSIDKNPSTIDYKLAQHFYDWHKKQDQSRNPMSDPNTDMHHLLSTFEQFTSAHRHMNIPDDT